MGRRVPGDPLAGICGLRDLGKSGEAFVDEDHSRPFDDPHAEICRLSGLGAIEELCSNATSPPLTLDT